MRGDRGHPCLVPELTAKSVIDVVPLARTLALMWFTRSEPFRPVEFVKDGVDGGEAHHVERFLLVQECDRAFLRLGIEEVYDHLYVDDVFPAISARDEASLVVAYLVRQDWA